MRAASSAASLPLGVVVAIAALACDSPPPPPSDGGSDAPEPPACDAPVPFEPGDPDGHADPLGAAAGEARAGRLATADVPADHTGLGLWAADDFVLANDRVALIVEAA